jgi:hypothetical protein
MAMVAHDKGAAKRTGVPQSVAKEFNRADAKTGILRRKKKKGGNGENTADQEEP